MDNVGMDVFVKFGDSRSNDFQDIRGADFVSNEWTNEQDEAYHNSVKRLKAFGLKIGYCKQPEILQYWITIPLLYMSVDISILRQTLTSK